jgi:hypothetical protein
VIAALRIALDDALRRLSPKSEVAKAIAYGRKRWIALTRFVEDGRLEIDNNNIAERAMRGIAIGRKNWLFAGSKAGGERAATIHTVIDTCKLNGVEPPGYRTTHRRGSLEHVLQTTLTSDRRLMGLIGRKLPGAKPCRMPLLRQGGRGLGGIMEYERKALSGNFADRHQQHGQPGLDHHAVTGAAPSLNAIRCFEAGIATYGIECLWPGVDMQRCRRAGFEDRTEIFCGIGRGWRNRKRADGGDMLPAMRSPTCLREGEKPSRSEGFRDHASCGLSAFCGVFRWKSVKMPKGFAGG